MTKDGVVLLHGIMRDKSSMDSLERALQSHGYKTLNITYPSTTMSIEEIQEYVHESIEEFNKTVEGKLDFVGHSMGGLVTRAYLAKHRPHNLGRVVMIGTPNKGSEAADYFNKWKLFKRWYGPAGQQLATFYQFAKDVFRPVDYELGVIAGDISLSPFGLLIRRKKNDGKVSVESTMLEGMADHIILHVEHKFMPSYKSVQQQVISFLDNGRFLR